MFCATSPSFAAKIMGVEIDIFWLTVLMFGSLATLLAMGLPLAFVTGGLACVFLFVFGDASALNIIPSRLYPLMTDYQLTAIPMFIFMASMLERAGIIEELFDMVYKMLGGLRGGLASSTVIASTLLAAMCGVIGATEVTMGLIALPAMLKRKYDRTIACGSILAGGTLGILIPPSILAILFAVVAQQSVGELFIGAVIPGLILSAMYILYISIRCGLNPSLGAGAAFRRARDGVGKIAPLKESRRSDCISDHCSRCDFHRRGDSGGSRRRGQFRGDGGKRDASAADRRQHSGGGDFHAESHRHGAVDYFRRDAFRRLLHFQRRAGIRQSLHLGDRLGPLRHFNFDDGDSCRLGNVFRLGRHFAFGGADFYSADENAFIRRRVRFAGESLPKNWLCGSALFIW